MATPLRKDEPEFEQNENETLTTADIAQGQRPAPESPGPKPVIAERNFDQKPRANDAVPLFPSGELDGLRTRWKEIQTGFVDEPRKAVQEADGLVASAMKRLAEVFAEERSGLERQWDRGDSVSTEDLRLALQKYRTFFDRLLSV
ncbi:MAG TPA: hypothetical protein VKV39_13435 [Candidatus Sulfotelmatobacter sp.]|nr:hypothetical protein [Candidatus Sulfotelmatobacter sp.]